MKKLMFLALVTLLLAVPACAPGAANPGTGIGGVGQVIGAIQQAEYTVSVMTLNLAGTRPWDIGSGTTLSWQDRYRRVAAWMKANQTTPDLIALQEVYGRETCSGFVFLSDYDTLITLTDAIREQTGVSYRAAHLAVTRVNKLLCDHQAGGAILYNPARLKNTTRGRAGQIVLSYDDSSVIGIHLRQSMPCNSPPGGPSKCQFIDLATPVWTSSYRMSSGFYALGLQFSTFELVNEPGDQINIYNAHPPGDPVGEPASVADMKAFISEMERDHGDHRLYPPILAGDFNYGFADMVNETANTPGNVGPYRDFEIAGYNEKDPAEVVGILVGERTKFPSKFAERHELRVLPTDQNGDSGGCISSVDILWSDHCAILVRFIPTGN